ncbi:hypothetical protein DMW02_24155 [Vibrio parahaemolyticus]|nr:hypothetical protein [Vibrio parahaemolyticus]EGR3077630.1 hypothetical protein [Vibrio parahaemolyticus]
MILISDSNRSTFFIYTPCNSFKSGYYLILSSWLDAILTKTHNAQLRGEQRYHPHLKHCAINTKFEVEAKMPSVVNPS